MSNGPTADPFDFAVRGARRRGDGPNQAKKRSGKSPFEGLCMDVGCLHRAPAVARAKNIPKTPVSKVTVAQAVRDVILYVLAHGKTWQLIVLMASYWFVRTATMADFREAAHFLLHSTVFAWGGWGSSVLVGGISSYYIARLRRASRRRIQELTVEVKRITDRESTVLQPVKR